MAQASKNLRVLNENLENAASLGQALTPMTHIWKDFMKEHAWKQLQQEHHEPLNHQGQQLLDPMEHHDSHFE